MGNLRAAEEQARQAAEAARQAEAGRTVLLFEEAKDRFRKRVETSTDYHAAHRGFFDRLGRAFKGRYLDQIARRDVLQYLEDRTRKAGAFADWPRTVGLRPAQTEIAALSALFGFLQDVEGYDREPVQPADRGRRDGRHSPVGLRERWRED